MVDNYDYKVVEVIRVVDGDTVDLRIDLGFRMKADLRFRLLDVDTPERHEAGWHECTQFTKDWLAEHAGNLRAATEKADSFGRWLASVYAPGKLEPIPNSTRVLAFPASFLADELNNLMEKNGWTSEAVR